jgi:hypothetical protein
MKISFILFSLLIATSSSFAQDQLQATVRDVTAEYQDFGAEPEFAPTPTPTPTNTTATGTTNNGSGGNPPVINPYDINPNTTPSTTTPTTTTTPINTNPVNPNGTFNDTMVKIDRIVALGERIWNFLVTNKPGADYEVFKTSVVPEGITSWTQLMKWSKPVSKIYRVEFKNSFGSVSGSFDYRLTYFHSGSFKGKGKFLGQISVVPTNIKLGTDRSLKMRVELASVINFGTEEDPIAGAQIIISWSSPTTLKYEMQSAEYLIYGNGDILDLSNGN